MCENACKCVHVCVSEHVYVRGAHICVGVSMYMLGAHVYLGMTCVWVQVPVCVEAGGLSTLFCDAGFLIGLELTR